MQFIFNEDSNLYGYAGGDLEFEFPSNIKQIGCIDDELKIYVEDYVYTYLYQYAKANGGKEKLAALAGRHMIIDGQEVIIISGAIQGRGSEKDKGGEVFTEETWNYINEQMKVYFKGLSLVGWVHTQPGFGAFLMAKDELFHKECFKEEWQTLFVIDPLDKLDTFFIHNKERSGLRAAKGYFVYYEKNMEMQEYMLENSLVRPKIEQEHVDVYGEENILDKEEIEKRRHLPEERIDAAGDIRRVLKKRAKEAEEGNKNRFTMLTGISGVLCMVCFLMGMSMMNNLDRLRKLETEIETVQTSYTTIAQKMEGKNAQLVFAASNEPKKEETKEEAKEEIKEEAKEEVKEEVNRDIKQEISDSDAILDIYVIEEGDNLGYISMKYYGTKEKLSDIMEFNGMDNPNKIIAGQKIKIPK